MEEFTGTYSPDDNKLRLYAGGRLEHDLFLRVKAAGFRWAPKQELFVAPMWTPGREDLLLELCGEITDEDTSLLDRAAERADRFEGYQENRAKDAKSAAAGVEAITEHIPLGQPILVGHHSEKRARKDAERIENGMRKAVKMWETSQYWEYRAAGAIRNAKYKEKPAVRARRIKKIQADLDRVIRRYTPKNPDQVIDQKRWYCPVCHKEGNRGVYGCEKHPEAKVKVPHVYCGASLGGAWTPVESLEAIKQNSKRWVQHYENRLIYEKAMLEDQGAGDLLKPKTRPKQLPLCNYRAPEGIRIENRWHRGEFSFYPQREMTRADFKKIYTDYKGTDIVDGSHRVRVAIDRSAGMGTRSDFCVFLTDSKVHKRPDPAEPKKPDLKKKLEEVTARVEAKQEPDQDAALFDGLKETLKEGVKIAVAPQLYPTPPEIAKKMIEYADIEPDHRVLEPSAGTGNLLKAIGPGPDKVAIELNYDLVQLLIQGGPPSGTHVHQGNFLECNRDFGKFDRIVMNPPFQNAEDIKHIKHALEMLAPGGRLVALCANGPRQRAAFMDQAEHWEDLPAGSFKEAGTNVNTALMVLTN